MAALITPPPLVSCVMPTAGRAAMVAQAVRHFQRQDYPRRELVIVYDHPADLPSGLDDPRLVLILSHGGGSIGAKRNLAVQHAAGSLIVQWDDDDWYAPERLSAQVAPILRGQADITALTGTLFYSVPEQRYWEASPELYRRMFSQNVAGGTLAYRREVWEKQARYPATSLREDADFLEAAMARGARLCAVPGRELFVYFRHGANSWGFEAGRFLDAGGWRQAAAPKAMGTRSEAPPASLPLVSCIMPTADRRAFVPDAIRHFLQQDYPAKELVIVDDGRQPVKDLVPTGVPIRYLRLDQRASVGAKRNLACEHAAGELLAHWDDDDWMAPGWLGSQVRTLRQSGADVCGLDKVLFHAPDLQRAWKYVYDGARPWVCGGTLCYTRAFWERNPFPAISIGEDNAFVWSRGDKRIAVNGDMRAYVATVHAGNTSAKRTNDRRWHAFPVHEIARLKALHSEQPEIITS